MTTDTPRINWVPDADGSGYVGTLVEPVERTRYTVGQVFVRLQSGWWWLVLADEDGNHLTNGMGPLPTVEIAIKAAHYWREHGRLVG